MSSSLKIHLDSLRSEISFSLGISAKEYFEVGLDLYAKKHRFSLSRFQAALGNFAISIELLLKCIVATRMFPKLYEGLSAESQAILTFPEAMPNGTLPNTFTSDLKSFAQKSIDLNQSISYFYLLYPDKKQELHPHLKVLAAIRNVAVHGAVPSFQIYQLERTAYLSCSLFLFADSERILSSFPQHSTTQAKLIVDQFNEDRIERVHKSIEAARSKTKSFDFLKSYSSQPDVWEFRVERCPVCGNDGTSYGYPQEDKDGDESTLTFLKDQFDCDCCGLQLHDHEELQLAGIEIAEDMTTKLDEWHHDLMLAGS